MFFRPNFCCNCGEKIERAEWKALTSRRFCDVCAVENQGAEWFPRMVVLAGVVAGLFGIGSFLRSGEPVGQALVRSERERTIPVKSAAQLRSSTGQDPAADAPPVTAGNEVQIRQQASPGAGQPVTSLQPAPRTAASDEPVYYCGAMTKKGKPCSRRVKTKGRCWQHVGQPSALETQTPTEVY